MVIGLMECLRSGSARKISGGHTSLLGDFLLSKQAETTAQERADILMKGAHI